MSDIAVPTLKLFSDLRALKGDLGWRPTTLTLVVDMGDASERGTEIATQSVHHVLAEDCLTDPGMIGDAVRALFVKRLDS